MNETKFYGKYRGTVTGNIDPLKIGRVTVVVPDVLGTNESTWALPCFPFAGKGSGWFAVPAVGARVWIEFEQGDPGYPIWTGGWWDETEDASSAAQTAIPGVQTVAFVTEGGHSLVVSDVPGPLGGFAFKHKGGAQITINEQGITIDNGQGAKITMTGPQVDINNQGLTVI